MVESSSTDSVKTIDQFRKENASKSIQETFEQITDRSAEIIFDRESTKHGSPINKSFNLDYDSISQAVLKVQLLADQGRILGIIPNEYKLYKITINGHVFFPSDSRNSVNVVERSNQNRLNKVLIPNGENTISIDFQAPIGAGVTSPDAEISAQLIINGHKTLSTKVNGILPNFTEVQKKIGQFIKDNTISFFALLIIVVIGILGLGYLIRGFHG